MTSPHLSSLSDTAKPRLSPGVRMITDRTTGQPLLVFPEAMVELKGPGKPILDLCDGQRTLAEIVTTLAAKYNAPASVLRTDVARYLERLRERRLVEFDGPQRSCAPISEQSLGAVPAVSPRPLGLIAEVTYRCPLHCPYCSNPTKYPSGTELTSDDWRRVLREAGEIGVLHALFSGGEPLARKDLEILVASAREAGLYTNLITSAVGLTQQRLSALHDVGLDSVQISFQADQTELADTIAGTTAHALKLKAAALVAELGFPLTINVVLHRHNIDRVARIIALAEDLGARRLELANTQFYGWAMRNRHALLPTREQVDAAAKIAAEAQQLLRGVMDILFVSPDYFDDRPKPCMNGWGTRYIAVNPVGDVLPCPTAGEIRGMKFENVAQHDLRWIWTQSESFNRYRGTHWMPEPCRSCDRREIDFGGCRCQAAILTGDAGNTDPVCALSPQHEVIAAALAQSNSERKFLMRTGPP